MCEYCGCQEIAVIAELTVEHDAVVSAIGTARRQLEDGELLALVDTCRRIADLLGPHTVVEEEGLFRAMADSFPEHVDALRSEHRQIEAVLSECVGGVPDDPSWTARLLPTFHLLREHILKEQDGVFPAALTSLSSTEWERIEGVRTRVGSGLNLALKESL
jgi:hemerythrin-like domain-containing protein